MRTLLFFLSFLLLPSLASAQSTDTLDKLRKTRVLLVGIRDNALPFSTLSQGMATGYSVELCNKVLEQVRKELKLPELRVQYVPVTATNRFAKLKDGSIDLECGQSVNTRNRQADVSFSYSIFIAGERFLMRKDAGIQEVDSLAGKQVAVVKGSTAEKLFGQLTTIKLSVYESNGEALKALDTGKVAAFAQLDIVLETQRLQSAAPDRLVLNQKSLSVEPICLAMRKDDNAFKAIVDKTLANVYSSGEINGIYNHWFTSGSLQIPMSKMLRDSVARPSHDAAVALGLGYQL